MISRVSLTTVNTAASSEPSNSSSLVNVMESKSQCEANLKTAQPCSYQPTYIAGTSQEIDYATFYGFESVALFDTYTLLLGTDADLFKYDYSTGITSYVGYSDYDSTTSSMAVDGQGVVYIISDCTNGSGSCIVALNTTLGIENNGEASISRLMASFPTRLNGITNDNAYNMYVFDNQTVYSLSSAGSIVPIFNIADFDDTDIVLSPQLDDDVGTYSINTTSIYSAAVYFDQTTQFAVLYYTSGSTEDGSEIFKYNFHTNALALVLEIDYIVAPIVAESADIVYLLTYTDMLKFNSSFDSRYDVDRFTSVDLPIGDRFRGLAISASGDRLVTTSSTDQIDFITTGVYMFDPSIYRLQTVMQQSFFAGAWFTCGDSLVSPVPQTTPEYGAKCAKNGFVGN